MEIRNICFLLLVLLCGCAQMVPPSGGVKDTIAPMVIEENAVPRNKTINFNSKTIVIPFDEYIKLTNPNEQIIVSPAMEEKPDFYLKGKKLYVKLNGELKPNTTYTINFGNAISDITENNPAAGLTYVFSTGPEIDSLSLTGQLTNAFTNAPEKNVWVMLHKNLSDTSLQKNFPDYLTKTDEKGNYNLQNLAAGEYNIFALRDGNSDFKYNQPSEEIAFADEKITVGENNAAINLKLFNEASEKQYVKNSRFVWPGKMQMVMNKSYQYWDAYILPYDTITKKMSVTIYKNAFGDTVDVWLRKPAIENGTEIKVAMLMERDSVNKKYDTITFRVSGVKEEIPAMKLKTNANENFGLYDKLKLKYDRPAFLWKKEKAHLYKNDSVEIPIETAVLGYGASFINKWEEKTSYRLILEDSAFADVFFGKYSKADTIKFTTVKKELYGNIIAQLTVPDSNYRIELLGAGDKVIYAEDIPKNGKMNLENLKPGNYKLRIYHDENLNWKWDTGNLKDKKQPERIWNYKEQISIRSNWDFDLNWIIEN